MSFNRENIDETTDFDYIIVGAGSAGCVMARRLIDGTEAKVLLLEAGNTDQGIASIANPPQWVENIGAAHDWSYAYAPSPHTDHRSLFLSRGKVLGGSGSTNALVWIRGNRADFDDWAAAGNPGWNYDSVLPLFKRSEDWEDGANDYRGSGGPLHIERAKNLHPIATALIDAGLSYGMPYLDDTNIPEPVGVGPINMNVIDGKRCSTAHAFLRPVMNNPRLTVLTNTQAVKLQFSGKRCVGIDFLRNGSLHSAKASTEVVLCAGAIDSPRLLMLSGVGPQKQLQSLGIEVVADLSGVGENLQDHPILAGLCFAAKQPLPGHNNNLEGSAILSRSRTELQVPDLMLISVQIPYVSPEIAKQFSIPSNSFCIAPGLMRVQSRGYLRMTTARHDGPLEIQPNFLAEQADLDALYEGVELGLELASQPAFRELIDKWIVPPRRLSKSESIAFIRQSCGSYFHPVGTCAMGTGSESVVDSQLRVHGIDGLRVADASIMPTITSTNTHATTVMIAEFASRLITQK
jgi:choline dehydrogenase